MEYLERVFEMELVTMAGFTVKPLGYGMVELEGSFDGRCVAVDSIVRCIDQKWFVAKQSLSVPLACYPA